MASSSNLSSPDESQGLGVRLPFQLGRFTLCRELGAGGMATVYLGRMRLAEGFERLVAVKTIHGHLAKAQQFVDMFLDEAQIASQISHPNVCSVFDFGSVGGTYYLALEYLMGEPLDDFINQVVKKRDEDLLRTLPYLAARIIAEACKGIHAAHETRGADGKPLGVVHRDVSPQNLFVSYDGSVKVVDFGCAKAVERVTQTDTGIMKGKVSYAAPEQLRGERLDSRVDVWALGVCLWETLTLRELFRRDTAIKSAMAVLEEKIPRADEVAEWVPKQLADIAALALQRDPEERYESAQDLGRDLRQFIAHAGVSFESAELAEWMGHLFEQRQIEVREMVLDVESGARDASAAEPSADASMGIGEADTRIASVSSRDRPTLRPPSKREQLQGIAPAESQARPRLPEELEYDEPVVLPTRSRGWFAGFLFLLLVGLAVGGVFWLGQGDPAQGWAVLTGTATEPEPATDPFDEPLGVDVQVDQVSVETAAEDALEAALEDEPAPEVAEAVDEGDAPEAPEAAADAPSPAAPSEREPRRAAPSSTTTLAPSAPTPPAPSGEPTSPASDDTVADDEAPVDERAVQRTTLDLQQGRIEVAAEGGWAEVIHNGTSLGRTPLRTALPVGAQRLRLLPYGREPGQNVNMNVEWGSVTRVRIRLAPQAAPATEGPAAPAPSSPDEPANAAPESGAADTPAPPPATTPAEPTDPSTE